MLESRVERVASKGDAVTTGRDWKGPEQRKAGERWSEGIDLLSVPLAGWIGAALVITLLFGCVAWGVVWARRSRSRALPTAAPMTTLTPSAGQTTVVPPVTGTPPTPGLPGALPTVPTTPTATATTVAPSAIAPGGYVKVAGLGSTKLRLRDDPSTGAAVLQLLSDGDVLRVLEGPVSAEGYEWWRLLAEDGAIGWAVADYLETTSPE